jgi:leader peptidase (prepilin peptidase)/N-methyltransferase
LPELKLVFNIITAAAAFGLLIGSFLNVVAIRLLKKESIVYPPSHCVHCSHPLKPADLVPVFSYIWLRGKCRYCRGLISPLYPFGELLTALLFGLMAWRFGWTPELVPALLFVSVCAVAVLTDIREMIIPNTVVGFGIAAIIILRIWIHPLPWWDYALAFFLGSGILYLFCLASKGGIGGGDIKLYAFIGIALGSQLTLLSLFLASLFGTLYGVGLIAAGRFRKGMAVPFGPFIVTGAVIALIWGEALFHEYWKLFSSV